MWSILAGFFAIQYRHSIRWLLVPVTKLIKLSPTKTIRKSLNAIEWSGSVTTTIILSVRNHNTTIDNGWKCIRLDLSTRLSIADISSVLNYLLFVRFVCSFHVTGRTDLFNDSFLFSPSDPHPLSGWRLSEWRFPFSSPHRTGFQPFNSIRMTKPVGHPSSATLWQLRKGFICSNFLIYFIYFPIM